MNMMPRKVDVVDHLDHDGQRCPRCGTAIVQPRTGRRRVYCSTVCRVGVHREARSFVTRSFVTSTKKRARKKTRFVERKHAKRYIEERRDAGGRAWGAAFVALLGVDASAWWREEPCYSASSGRPCGLAWARKRGQPSAEAIETAISGETRSGKRIGPRGVDVSTTHTAHGQLDFDLHDIDEQVGVALEQLIQPETPEDFDRLRDALDRRKGEGRRLWTRARRRLIEQAAARVRLAVDDALPWLRCVVMRSPRGVRVLVLWDRPIACEKAARIMEAIRDRVGDVGGLSRAEVFPTPAGRTGRLALARMRIVDAHGALMHRTRRADLEWLLRHGGAMRHGVAELAELVPRRRTRRRPEPREQTTRGAPSGDDKLCGTDFFAAVVGYLTQGLPRGETWLASHRIAFAAIGLGLGDDDARQLLDHAINHTGHDGACHALTETGRRGAHAMLTHALGRYRRGGMRAGLIADEELRTVVSDVLGVELAAPFQAREVDRARISQIRSAAARRRWAPDRAVDAVTPRRMTTPEFFAALAAA